MLQLSVLQTVFDTFRHVFWLFPALWLQHHQQLMDRVNLCYIKVNLRNTRLRTPYCQGTSNSLPQRLLHLWIRTLSQYLTSMSVCVCVRARVSSQKVVVWLMYVTTFCFCLTWQFNQFILLVQALIIYTLDCVDILTTAQVRLQEGTDDKRVTFMDLWEEISARQWCVSNLMKWVQ